jgi:hypothetical protein
MAGKTTAMKEMADLHVDRDWNPINEDGSPKPKMKVKWLHYTQKITEEDQEKVKEAFNPFNGIPFFYNSHTLNPIYKKAVKVVVGDPYPQAHLYRCELCGILIAKEGHCQDCATWEGD